MVKNYLNKKNILITGVTSGIGKILTECLSSYGANIIMLSKNEAELDAMYDEMIKKDKTDPLILKCDLEKLNEENASKMSKIVQENYANLDAVIFNAAILGKMSDIESYDQTTWEKILKVDLTSTFLME